MYKKRKGGGSSLSIFKIIISVLCMMLMIGFVSCSDDDDDDDKKVVTPDGGGGGDTIKTDDVPEGYCRLCYEDKSKTATDFWLWGDGVDTTFFKNPDWAEKAFTNFKNIAGFDVFDVKLSSEGGPVMFIPRSAPGSDDAKMTGDVILSPRAGQVIFIDAKGKNFYTDQAMTEGLEGIDSAYITSKDGNTIKVNVVGYSKIEKSQVTVKDKDGTALTVSTVALADKVLTVTVTGGALNKAPYTVKIDTNEKTVTVDPEVNAQIADEMADDIASGDHEVKDFGVTVTDTGASFKMWAPTADSVKLLLFASATDCGVKGTDIAYGKWKTKPADVAAANIKDMTKGDNGVWSVTLNSTALGANKYYKYRITRGTKVYDIADIWSKACAPDGVASQIVDINTSPDAAADSKTYGTIAGYVNPFGGSGNSTQKKYSEAVIYEMHIWDWGAASATANDVHFEDFASDANIAHLNDLGVTHVQILPMYEYATTRADTRYNWGYDPYHYNVPESRYSAAADGAGVVKSMRTMINKLHAAGIAVIMDVVYNHTSGTGESSLYDMTEPKYFYRLNADGTYANGSGCGNETATNHAMYKKYVLDSLKHWMLDYHINGFRFDLMGIHEKETMKEFYDELVKIDKNVMVYGEPWTGGTSLAEAPSTTATKSTSGANGVAAFDDGIRDAIKGSVFDRIVGGQVQGEGGKHLYAGEKAPRGGYNDEGIIDGLTKGGHGTGSRNETGDLNLSIRYVACHDNNTLFDKLCLANSARTADTEHAKHVGDMLDEIDPTKNEPLAARLKAAGYFEKVITDDDKKAAALEYIKDEDKLAAAYMILAQGTPFLYGGQDFCRTKLGNDNSYGGESTVTLAQYHEENYIDLTRKRDFEDVYNVYKGLIALRKANPRDFGAVTTEVSAEVFTGTIAEPEDDSDDSSDDAAPGGKGRGDSTTTTATAAKIPGTTVYITPNFKVIYNATDSTINIAASDLTGYTKEIDVSSGAPVEVTDDGSGKPPRGGSGLSDKVPPKSFVIFKK